MNWQETITWLDGLAASGDLYADNLRAGILLLQNVPIPRPAVIEEKLGDWQYALDNQMVPERNTGGAFTGAGIASGLSSISPVTIGIGLLALFFVFGRKKTRD